MQIIQKEGLVVVIKYFVSDGKVVGKELFSKRQIPNKGISLHIVYFLFC